MTGVLAVDGAAAPPAADLLLVNGKIWTGNPAQPEAEAVACRNGRILAVGTNAAVRAVAGDGARRIDLGGKRVVPGFNDAHLHFHEGGTRLKNVKLRDAASEAVFRDRIAAFASRLPKGQWILGGDWDHENWSPARLPTRALIDAATPDHAVFVSRLDGHMALANSLALKLAGITRETKDPPGGEIVRDAGGEPTGVLKDAAMNAVFAAIPPPAAAEIVDSLRAAMRYAAENGVTSVQDMSGAPEILAVYQRMLERGELTVRVYAHQPLATWKRLADVGIRAAFGGPKLKIGGLKGFADGSLGSTTALFFEPYRDAPHTAGLPADEMIPESRLRDHLLAADAAGLQAAIHAIGDKANHIVLGMFEETARRNGPCDRRLRIEHAQHLTREDAARFGKLGVIASMQPYHAIDDGRWAENRLGKERLRGAYAFRWLLDGGAVLAFGSDWFVAPIEPLLGIYAAVTRSTLDEKHPGGWVPEQKLTVAEAVRAYTYGGAYASFEEKEKGTLEPGKLADMAVLSEDIFAIRPERIRETRVVMTVFDGRVVHPAP